MTVQERGEPAVGALAGAGAEARQADKVPFRIIVLASLGGALEFYDFIVYGVFAAYIAATFFPATDPLISLINVFAVFAVGYLSRPLGGILFSHFGDKFGRRNSFLVSLLVMTLATLAMAVMPGYATGGILATALFVLLRFIQGCCVGGEMPGAITYVVETMPKRAGLACGVVFFCVNTGVLLASSVSAGLHNVLTPAEMQEYGWRIAFGLGGVLGLVSYWLRGSLEESPAFAALKAARPPKVPLFSLLRDHPGPVLVGIGTTAIVQAFNGIVMVYMPAYLIKVAGYDPKTAAMAVNIAIGVLSIGIPAAGFLSDLVPRRYIHRTGAALLLLGSYPALLALNGRTVDPYVVFILTGLAGMFANGTFGAVLADLFPTRVRFSGIAVSYNISAAVFAGFAPLVITWMMAETGNKAAPAFYLMAAAAVSLIAGFWLKRYKQTVDA